MRIFRWSRYVALRCWGLVDARAAAAIIAPEHEDQVDWLRAIPYLAVHVACIGVIWTGCSLTAVLVCLAAYAARMFAITGFYHRYFSHRSFRTSRVVHFMFAVLADMSAQRGPIWWSAHHRRHHRHSDTAQDVHSPRHRGFWWSHFWWPTSRRNYWTTSDSVKDWEKFPELVLLDRFHTVPPILLAVGMFCLGCGLNSRWPELGTSGSQLLFWGFFVSTVCVYHGTFAINSLAHLWGSRRYATGDDSRNSLLLALLTFGEGWHNNHHFYPRSVRQGFYWWEIDLTYYVLKLMERLGLIWDLHVIPRTRRDKRALLVDEESDASDHGRAPATPAARMPGEQLV